MRLQFTIILFLLMLSCQPGKAVIDREYLGFENRDEQVIIHTNDGHYSLVAYTDHIVEASFIPENEKVTNKSHAVVLKPEKRFDIEEKPDELLLKTAGIVVSITKDPFQIAYTYNNEILIAEGKGYFRENDLEVLDFNITEDEVLWGGGARALGMNRRGHRLELYNKAHYGYETHSELMNFTMPLVFSSRKYGIHFDNAPIGYLDLDSKQDNTLRYETISGRKTYQVIAGDDWYEIVDHYTDLTGKQPMIPRWALGNYASRFGYHSQQETEAVIDKFIAENVPVDAVVLDLYWFGKDIKGTLGNFEFYKDSFPDPVGMIQRLKQKGVKTVLITEPFVLTTSKRWEEAVQKDILGKRENGEAYTYDFYFGNTGIIDIFKQDGHDWFWNIYKKFTDMGVAGWWGDLGEPEVHPSDLIHETGTADELHNIYGHEWAALVYNGYRKHYPDVRPFILMRAGYSGSQRYGMIPWSGDVNRTWGGLRSQPEIALQMGMQGMGFMHSDLGGFAGPNLDDELYVRWLQYGVFQPIYRPHAQEEVPSEPVFRSEEVLNASREAIQLRYRMLPYNYTLAYLNHTSGQPLMRPLFFDNPNDQALFNYEETFLWGPDMLVSPVLEQGITEKEVVFPQGSNWIDFYDGSKFKGGKTATVPVRADNIPTYVRGGAFIPMTPIISNTEAYDPNKLELHYYYDADISESTGICYHDDGLNANAVALGQYELLRFRSEITDDELTITIDRTAVDSEFNNIKLIIHHFENEPIIPKNSYSWDKEKQLVVMDVILKEDSNTISIKLSE